MQGEEVAYCRDQARVCLTKSHRLVSGESVCSPAVPARVRVRGAKAAALAALAALAAVSVATTPAGEASAVPGPAGGVAAGPGGVPRDAKGLVRLPSGRRIYLECRGRGSPTVVLEAGGGDGGDIWQVVEPGSRLRPVLPAVARFTRVCAYDRPGTVLASGQPSRSDPVSLPRAGAAMVAELRALLAAAGVPGPFVLVGHSFGGALTRLYASRYPRQVVGFVSVDAATEIIYERGYLALLPAEASNPPGAEFRLAPLAAELGRARVERPLQPMPMIVLEHSRDRRRVPNPLGWPPDYPIHEFERVWHAAQDDLATLLPHTLHWIATRSGHYIQVFQPDLVIRAIRRVVDELRPVAVRCRGGASVCRARVSLGGGASNKRVTIRVTDNDLRLVSVRPNRRSLRGAYGLSNLQLTEGGSGYRFTLNAVQTIRRGAYLTLTFRVLNR
jgi:pimeloyl-ACP methyl ester carboxylesterase